MTLTRRFGQGLLAVLLLTAALFAVTAVTTAQSAEARCRDGVPMASDYWQPYLTVDLQVAQERPRSGTCDGDSSYRGILEAPHGGNGICAAVHFADTGGSWAREAYTCSSASFQYDDPSGDSVAWERLCATNFECGWGHTRHAAGVNRGF